MVANVKFNRLGEIGRAGGQEKRIITHLRERTLKNATIRPTLAAISERVLTPILEGRAQVAKEVVSEALKMKIEMNKRMRQLPAERPAAKPKPVAAPLPTPQPAPEPVDDMSGRPTHIHQAAELLQSAAQLAAATAPKPVPAAEPKPAASNPKPVVPTPLPTPLPAPAPQAETEKTRAANLTDLKLQELTDQIKKLEDELKTANDNFAALNERHTRLTGTAANNVTELNKRQQTIDQAKRDTDALQKELKNLREAKERADKALQTAKNELRDLKAAQTSAIAQAKLVAFQEGQAKAQADFGQALSVINSQLANPEKLLNALSSFQVEADNPDLARLVTFLKLMASEKLG